MRLIYATSWCPKLSSIRISSTMKKIYRHLNASKNFRLYYIDEIAKEFSLFSFFGIFFQENMRLMKNERWNSPIILFVHKIWNYIKADIVRFHISSLMINWKRFYREIWIVSLIFENTLGDALYSSLTLPHMFLFVILRRIAVLCIISIFIFFHFISILNSA